MHPELRWSCGLGLLATEILWDNLGITGVKDVERFRRKGGHDVMRIKKLKKLFIWKSYIEEEMRD